MQTPEETLTLRLRLVPRQRLAAGADPAPPRPRRALRLRLSDPAQARRQAARRARRRRRTTSPTCTPGPRSICPAPAGSASTRPPACCPARATSRWPRRRITAPPRRSPAWSSRREVDVRLRDERRRASPRQPRVTEPFSDEPGRRSTRSARRSTPTSTAQRRAPDHGRRADLRLDRRLPDAPNGTPTRSGRPSAIRADELIRRLRDRFAPGGLLHYGQGKWYPGEPLPRWAFSLYWRKRRRADLARPTLIARESKPARRHRPTTRSASPRRIAARLGLAADYVQPAYEDPVERLLKEGELPANVDPSDPKLDDPDERARIVRDVRPRPRHAGRLRAADAALERAGASRGWLSETGRLRRGRLFLIAGQFAGRLPPAAAVAALCRRRPTIRIIVPRRSLRRPRRRCPSRGRRRSRRNGARRWRPHGRRRAAGRPPAPTTAEAAGAHRA